MFHSSKLDTSRLRSHHWARALLRAGSCLLLVGSLLSVSAFAASLKDVRVGIHPRFTRVVLESDGPVGFQIDRSAGDELQVVLDAAAYQRVIASASGHLRSVRIEPRGDGTAVARLKLRGTAITHTHLVLDNPSRLVIDLKTDSNRSAAAPVVHRIGPKDETPKTSAPSVASDRASPAVAATDPVATTGAGPGEDDFGRDHLERGAGQVDEFSAKAEAASEVDHQAGAGAPDVFRRDSSFRELLEDVRDEEAASNSEFDGAESAAFADPVTGDTSPVGSSLGDTAAGGANLDGASIGSEVAKLDSSPRAEPSPSGSEPAQPQGFTGFLPAAIDHPLALGSIGVALLMLLIFLVVRGQRSSESYESSTPFTTDEPFSLDDAEVVSAVDDTGLVAEASEPADEEPLAAGSNGLTAGAEVGSNGLTEGTSGPLGTTGMVDPPAPDPVAAGAEATANGLLDQAPEDEFPALKDGGVKPPPPVAVAPVLASAEPALPASNGTALPVMVDERLSGLEERVNELADAKERLERQVAAQSEELRVQRAAIARTQRVLRTVVRPEDEASEPVPKVS